jgi:citrate lyase subunit beta/citryl-CoA lyase
MDLSEATTFLFVPGDRVQRFERAASSGADVVILDLEDGVDPASRATARGYTVDWLRSGRPAVVRVSACGTEDHELDVRALRGLATRVMLAKTESVQDAAATAAALDGPVEIVALIETARGVAAAGAVAAQDVVVRLAFGNVDLATDLGVDANDRRALLTARSLLTLASSAAGIAGPVDGVTTSIHDAEQVRADAAEADALGFRGKLCIHPAQVASARAGFRPSAAQVAWARNVLASASAGEARNLDGVMVDRPVEEKARAVLRRAGLGT